MINFNTINTTTIETELDQLLQSNREKLDDLTQQKHASWTDLVEPCEKLQVKLGNYWNPIGHLNNVKNTDELRKVYQTCLPKLSAYYTELGQNKALFNAFHDLTQQNDYKNYDNAQKKLIDDALKEFHLAGVDLSAENKKRYQKIVEQLTQLTNQFEENIMDSTHGWTYLVDNKDQLSGLPEHAIQQAKMLATEKEQNGWLLTLDSPCYHAVMTYANDRLLREKMYYAYTTRASDQGPNAGQWDNSEVMNKIIALRHEKAKLLGFNNYAELSLDTKMAKNPQQVLKFLQQLVEHCKPVAKQEVDKLCAFAKQLDDINNLEPWDVAYYSEKLKQQQYSIDQEALRAYFPIDTVLQGLFSIVNKLYGIHFQQVDNSELWNDEVKLFTVNDEQGLRGHIYMDLYARRQKRGGAWVDEGKVYYDFNDNDKQLPVTFLTCNFSSPVDNISYLTHDEVITLFHEFGHAMHHLLTKAKYPSIAGFNGVPWDAIEFPSQFMENWCWQYEALQLLTRHKQSGETLPKKLFQQLTASKNFHSGLFLIRQLEFALFDFQLYKNYQADEKNYVQNTLDATRKKVSVINVPDFNRFQHSFSHIFAGGYAAGYYSYLWAEVLAADAFGKFLQNGIFDHHTGQQFLHCILEKGGSAEPMDLYVTFMGRQPEIKALLASYGLEK